MRDQKPITLPTNSASIPQNNMKSSPQHNNPQNIDPSIETSSRTYVGNANNGHNEHEANLAPLSTEGENFTWGSFTSCTSSSLPSFSIATAPVAPPTTDPVISSASSGLLPHKGRTDSLSPTTAMSPNKNISPINSFNNLSRNNSNSSNKSNYSNNNSNGAQSQSKSKNEGDTDTENNKTIPLNELYTYPPYPENRSDIAIVHERFELHQESIEWENELRLLHELHHIDDIQLLIKLLSANEGNVYKVGVFIQRRMDGRRRNSFSNQDDQALPPS
eukprot:Awhi_evm1s8251